MKNKLIASSPTTEGLAKIINEYLYSKNYTINKDTLKIENPAKELQGYKVVNKKARYQFIKEN